VLTLAKGFDDEGEGEKAEEQDIEFLEAGEDAPVAFESAEEPFDLIALSVESAIVTPGIDAVAFRRPNRNHAQFKHQLARLVALVGAVHDQRQRTRHGSEGLEQVTALRRVVRLARGKGKSYRRSSIRGNQMNLGVPASA
jgi:hypothetical protein